MSSSNEGRAPGVEPAQGTTHILPHTSALDTCPGFPPTICVRRGWRPLLRRLRACAADAPSAGSSSTDRCHTMPVQVVLGAMLPGAAPPSPGSERGGRTVNSVSTTTVPALMPARARPSPASLPGACHTVGGMGGGDAAARTGAGGREERTRPGPPTVGRCSTKLLP